MSRVTRVSRSTEPWPCREINCPDYAPALRNINSNYPAGLRDAELVTVTQCDEDIYRVYAE